MYIASIFNLLATTYVAVIIFDISIGPNPVRVTARVNYDRYYKTFSISLSWRVRLYSIGVVVVLLHCVLMHVEIRIYPFVCWKGHTAFDQCN